MQDYEQIGDLQYKMAMLKDDYRILMEDYNNKALSAKIAGFFPRILKKLTRTVMFNAKISLPEFIVSKLPSNIISVIKIKKSLSVLKNINKSVDDLVTMAAPYGGGADKYAQLSKYIVKANSIQSEIAGSFNKLR